MPMMQIKCTNCQRPYPELGFPFRCPDCGGYYDYADLPVFDLDQIISNDHSIWRFRHAFGLPLEMPKITLGEGDTPLIWSEVGDHRVAFKSEYLNPTGSFKDRGTSLLVSLLSFNEVTSVIDDSSGNAGASLAAYAARAGLKAKIFVPDYSSGPKREQIEIYGAEVVRVMGSRSNVTEAVFQAAEGGSVYASHARLPFGLLGFSTIAYELFSQMVDPPGTILCPVGNGSLLLGIGRGFVSLKRAGLIDSIPNLVGVQSRACAPLWALYNYGPAGLGWVSEGETLAEGIRIINPIHGDALFHLVEAVGGSFITVEETQILPGRDQLARLGYYVEPTSAVVWGALQQILGVMPDPIVVILTGSGFKSRK
jgi:threonine synthase